MVNAGINGEQRMSNSSGLMPKDYCEKCHCLKVKVVCRCGDQASGNVPGSPLDSVVRLASDANRPIDSGVRSVPLDIEYEAREALRWFKALGYFRFTRMIKRDGIVVRISIQKDRARDDTEHISVPT